MNHRWIAMLLLVAARMMCAQTNLVPPATIADLRQRLAEHLAEPRFAAAQWGVKIVSLDTGKTLFEENAGKLLSPASNTKLFTCALALERLGPQHRIKTSLYTTNHPDAHGVLRSDLIVFGRGDPCFTARRADDDILRALAPLIVALTNAGVRTIQGDLIGDDSYLPGPALGSGWDWDDAQHAYGAELSALSINDNVVRLRIRPASDEGGAAQLIVEPVTRYVQLINLVRTVGSNEMPDLTLYRPPGGNLIFVNGHIPFGDVSATNSMAVHNPARFFVSVLREALERAGVRVAGSVRTMGWRERQQRPIPWDQWIELGSVESPPLREIVRDTLKRSPNLYAGLLLEYVGVQRTATNTLESAEARGVRELGSFLNEVGISDPEFFFNEGSGLSRENLVTANAIVRLLGFMSRHAAAEVFTNSMPVAGVDGTLEKRMIGTAAEKTVRAKTGALRWASALSGYVDTAGGERLAFALLLNRHQNPAAGRPAGRELDSIAVGLAGLQQHSRDWKP